MEKLKLKHAKQIGLAAKIKDLNYFEALRFSAVSMDLEPNLDIFDASYVLAVMYEKDKEGTFNDLIRVREALG